MVEPQPEIRHVPEAVRLPFESFDFVVDSFYDTVGDEMFEIVENPCLVPGESPGHLGQFLDPGIHCVLEPDIQKIPCALGVRLFPKEPELLLHEMSGEQRLIRMKQSVESGLPVGLKGVVVSEQQKAIAFERLLSEVVQFFLLLPAEFVQRLVHEPHYVETVKDNVHVRKALAHSRVVTAAHVHGHSLKAFGFAGQYG